LRSLADPAATRGLNDVTSQGPRSWPGAFEETVMAEKSTKTRPWDAAEHLESEEDMVAYLEAALEEGDASLVAAALGDIARAEGV
jgi:hypothetical protein